MTTLRSLRAASLLALLASVPAFGAAYLGSAYEGFDYTSGAMSVSNGGTGWNETGDVSLANTTSWGTTLPSGTPFAFGTTAANQTITGATLNHAGSGYPAGTGKSVLITGAGQVGRNFGQTVDAGTLYFSYLVKKTMAEVRTVNFSFFGDTGGVPNERFAFGQIANNTNLRISDGTADLAAATKANQGKFAVLVQPAAAQAGGTFIPTTTAAPYPAGNTGVYTAASEVLFEKDKTFLIVGKIEFNYNDTDQDGVQEEGESGNFLDDRITVYIFNPDGSPTSEPASAYITLDKFNIGALVGFRVFAGGTSTTPAFTASAAEFDEIRFGTTFAAVTTGVTAPPVTPLQTWLDLHFTTPEQSQPTLAGLNADPDGDGRANLLEYALGCDPRAADLASELVTRAAPGLLALDYPALRSDLSYLVETSTDLATWGTAGVTDTLTGGGASAHMRTATVPLPGTGRVFLRLRVTQLE